MLSAGTRLHDRYLVTGIISRGGMGVVYHATDENLGTRVAVKELGHENLTSEEMQMATEQFLLEGEILASLEHPGLPRVYDYFEQDGCHYLVMDCIEGRTLEQVCRESNAPLSEARVTEIGIALADILDYLHHHDPPVIYRDLKPANVMLRDDGQFKLIDFGISKRHSPETGTALFAKGAGTPGYAPPEQYTMDSGGTDARSDLYALGATLYTLLTLEIPAQATDRWMGAVPLVPPRRLQPTLSPALEQVVLKLLELKPEQRYGSAQEVRDDLRSLQAGRQARRRESPVRTVAPQLPAAAEALAPPTGAALLHGGRHADARRHYQALLERERDSAEAHMGLGAAWLASGSPRKAFPHLRRGVELDPRYPLGSLLADLEPAPSPQDLYQVACWFLKLRTQEGHLSADVLLHLCRSNPATPHGLYARAGELHRQVYRDLRLVDLEGPASLRRRQMQMLLVLLVLAFATVVVAGWYFMLRGQAPARRATQPSSKASASPGPGRKPGRSGRSGMTMPPGQAVRLAQG